MPQQARAAARDSQKKADAAAAKALAAAEAAQLAEAGRDKKDLAAANVTIDELRKEISGLHSQLVQAQVDMKEALVSKAEYGHTMYLEGLRAGAELAHGRSLHQPQPPGPGQRAEQGASRHMTGIYPAGELLNGLNDAREWSSGPKRANCIWRN